MLRNAGKETTETSRAVVVEEERRRADGRAQAALVNKLKKMLKIYHKGQKKPSTPEEIGRLLREATK